MKGATFELAAIEPVAADAAPLAVLIGDDDVLVSIGVGGHYELDADGSTLPELAALLEAVAVGRYVEDIRVGASRYETPSPTDAP